MQRASGLAVTQSQSPVSFGQEKEIGVESENKGMELKSSHIKVT